MTTLEEIRAKRDAILSIMAKYGIEKARVFGSVARAEDDERSDVDFLIDAPKTISLLDILKLKEQLENALGRKIDVATPDMLKERIKSKALSESVPL